MTPELAKQIDEARSRAENEQRADPETGDGFCNVCGSNPWSAMGAADVEVGTVELQHGRVMNVCVCRRWTDVQMYKFYHEVVGFDTANETDNKVVEDLVRKLRSRLSQNLVDHLRKEMRRITYNNREYETRFIWQRDLPEEVVNWANSMFHGMVDDSCQDNYRVANMKSKRQMRALRNSPGCCGRHEEVHEYRGEKYLFALNYGH